MKKYCLAIVLVALLALVGCAEHEHSWDSGVVTKPATCTEEGEMTYTCLVCEVTRTEEIDATGHKWVEGEGKAATCIEDGVKVSVCEVCKARNEEPIPATGNHTWDSGTVTTEPSCIETGVKTFTCTVCKETKPEVIDALGHAFGSDGKCKREGCNAKETSEARIGTKYFDTLKTAIESLKTAESKTATINILVDSVNLDVINNVLPKENHYNISIIGKGRDNSTLTVLTTNGGSDGSRVHYADNVDLEFKSIKVDFGGNANYQGFVRATSLVFDDCIISGMASYWGVGETVFKNCVFEDNNGYNLWLYSGSKFVFENCVFNSSKGRFINAYQPGNTTNSIEVEIKGCRFVGETEEKAGINIKAESIWNVSIKDTLCEGVKSGSQSGSPLYDVSLSGDDGVTVKPETTVTIDGAVVWSNGAKKEN